MRSTPLSPVDLAFTGANSYSVEFLFTFPYLVSEAKFRRALNQTCQMFYPLAGNLVNDAAAGLRVEANADPVPLRVMKLAGKGPDLSSPRELSVLSEAIHSLPGEKLSRFLLAHTDSTSLVGVHLSHAIVDGYSFFYFLSALSAFYRDPRWDPRTWLKHYLMRPHTDRAVLCAEKSDPATSRHRLKVDADDLFRRTGVAWGPPRNAVSLQDAKWEVLDFPDAQISQMLKDAQKDCESRLSKHDVLTAHVWKHTAKTWDSAGDTLSCSNAFDYRRVHTGLTGKYFGNAIRCASLKLEKQDVLNLPLGQLAEQIRKTTAAITDATVRDSLVCFDEIRKAHGYEIFKHVHVSDLNNGVLVTNLSRVPVKNFDLGKGPPSEVTFLTSTPRGGMVLARPGGLRIRLQPLK